MPIDNVFNNWIDQLPIFAHQSGFSNTYKATKLSRSGKDLLKLRYIIGRVYNTTQSFFISLEYINGLQVGEAPAKCLYLTCWQTAVRNRYIQEI